MTLPGVTVSSASSGPSSTPPTDTGKWFVVGMTEQGPLDSAVSIRNMADYARLLGARVAYGTLYDSLETFFAEGGSEAIVGRVGGPSPVKASGNLSDGSGTTLVARAKYAGDYGNTLSVVTTVPGAGTFQFAVRISGVVVETSPVLNTVAEAQSWASTTSQYVDFTVSGANDPVAATTSLSGGTDDHSNATETQWAAAIALFTKDKGPGQVSAPGRTTLTTQTALLAHSAANNRVALLDTADSATVSTHTSQAASLRALSTARYGGLFGPWAVVPGLTPGTTRTVPYTAVQAGLTARLDALGANANAAAAGVNGRARFATGLSQAAWTDTDRETLNDAGVNVARVINSVPETYGYRTLVNGVADSTWLDLGNARLNMQIAAGAFAIGERFVFRQATARTAAEFGAAIAAEILSPLYGADALYGDSPSDAYSVDIGSQVNTDTTLGQGKLNAAVTVRMSRNAELVTITITKEIN